MGGGASFQSKVDTQQVKVRPGVDCKQVVYNRERAWHVAIVGAGFVGTSCAFALVCKGTGANVTLTDVNAKKCEGEVLDLEDGGAKVAVATPKEAGQADVIVITAGRAQREGETRLDLVKANSGIMRSVIEGMKPLNPRAKIIVVSNPCDVLTYVAQECSGLPESQVFGSGTVLDSMRLRIAVSQAIEVSSASINLMVLGEHGDSQFPVASLANIGGVPMLKAPCMRGVDLDKMAKDSASKAYDIIAKKGYTAFGIGQAVETIVDAVINDRGVVLPVSVRVPGRSCCLSMPSVVRVNGVERVVDNIVQHFSSSEASRFQASVEGMEKIIAGL